MARNKKLREIIANQLLDAVRLEHIESPLPSQASLADLFSVSRTTIRHIMNDLRDKGILSETENGWVIARLPSEDDEYATTMSEKDLQSKVFEVFFNDEIKNKRMLPGQEFTELELSKRSKCSTSVVREHLIRFSRFNFIENINRGRWRMIRFDVHYAASLIELREMLECHALNRFMNLPRSDERWLKAQYLLYEHRELREAMVSEYQAFSELDHKFHSLLLSASNNPFMDQFYDIISVIFHYHYQWDNTDLRKRNMVAIEEHMAILSKMISGDDLGAMGELRRHLQTAKRTMENSLITNSI
ncbi:GntR family transcriptional regulator [Vibrio spartinae]|uniref:HTH-type transcriptional regulator YjjM n=1 Tax=Vibrio spartinae TaxID=1918945 RepID=A0A1N6M8F5_9VIBR|nr:GntR family transcriptional regulator [Vibrio spartinae]QMV13614.1 putative HTH-type transcriptional regulator YjjM [Vibrio spartinae]SIO95725.1 putative HTH-type transcriptional regulator YjjM [Vibrio spartinae]